MYFINLILTALLLGMSLIVDHCSRGQERVVVCLYVCLSVCCLVEVHCDLLSSSAQQRILDLHNEKRGLWAHESEEIVQMEWDSALAELIDDYVQTCPDLNHGHLTDNAEYINYVDTYGPIGQNLYQATSKKGGDSDVETAVLYWYDKEIDDYDTTTGVCSGTCGHATQMMWHDTQRLGCAEQECDGYYTLFCDYFPAGNMVGELAITSGAPCSDCDPEYCVDDICICADLCDLCPDMIDDLPTMCDENSAEYNYTRYACKMTCGFCDIENDDSLEQVAHAYMCDFTTSKYPCSRITGYCSNSKYQAMLRKNCSKDCDAVVDNFCEDVPLSCA